MTPIHKCINARITDDHVRQHKMGRVGIDAVVQSLKAQQYSMGTSTAIDASGVAQFYSELQRDYIDLSEHFPNSAPPFDRFTLFYQVPEYVVLRGEKVRQSTPGSHVCLPCIVADKQTAESGFISDVMNRTGLASDCRRAEAARWIVAFSPWGVFGNKVSPYQVQAMCVISDKGIPLSACLWDYPDGADVSAVTELAKGTAFILLFALSFMNCRNITLEDDTERRNPRPETLRKMKLPKVTFKTLKIDAMRQILKTDGRSEDVGLARAMHLCRGHFATYENGLFNRTPGQKQTVFIPQHVRGNIKNGAVVKDYSLKVKG